MGSNALLTNTTGVYNVAIGGGALPSNTTGQQNMAIGTEALNNNNGNFNLAIGFRVGFMNTTGSQSHRNWRCSLQEQHDRFGQHGHWFRCSQGKHNQRV